MSYAQMAFRLNVHFAQMKSRTNIHSAQTSTPLKWDIAQMGLRSNVLESYIYITALARATGGLGRGEAPTLEQGQGEALTLL